MGRGPYMATLTYLFIPHHHLPLEKIHHCSLSRILALKPTDSISLVEAPFPKLFRGIVAWYVTPPFVQLVFALVVYILNN